MLQATGNQTATDGEDQSQVDARLNAMDFDYGDLNSTNEHMDYVNPLNVPAVRVTFIFLYSLVFASCFVGELPFIFICSLSIVPCLERFFIFSGHFVQKCIDLFCPT